MTTTAMMRRNEEVIRAAARRLTRAPRLALAAAAKEAFRILVESTTQDSGNAAFHWTIVGYRGSDVQDSSRVPFSVKYGHGPIGNKGDSGANSAAVVAQTVRDGYRIIDDMVWRQNRVAFSIYNDLANTGDSQYLQNAGISEKQMTEATTRAMAKARLAARQSGLVFDLGQHGGIVGPFTGANR